MLGEQLDVVRRAHEAALARLEAARALPAAFLRSVFASREAQSWPRVRLGDICDLVNGDAYRESDWSSKGTPIIRIQNLNDPSKPFNHWPGAFDGRVAVKTGDLLLAWSGTPGTSFGAHVWQGGVGLLNQHIFRVDLDRSRISTQWARFAIHEQLDNMIGAAHGGVGLRHDSRPETENLRIVLPPLSKQQELESLIDQVHASNDHLIGGIETELVSVDDLPQSLLRRAFAGEL